MCLFLSGAEYEEACLFVERVLAGWRWCSCMVAVGYEVIFFVLFFFGAGEEGSLVVPCSCFSSFFFVLCGVWWG